MSPNPQQTDAMANYDRGQVLFERGQYRNAIDCFQKALTLTQSQSALGGEVQLWLVTAYDAAGQHLAALDLCRQLNSHSDHQTRQKSRQLLYILEAPKLQMRAEWLTQIPDLSQPDPLNRSIPSAQTTSAKKHHPNPPTVIQPFEPIDPKDSRGFLGLAFSASVCLLIVLWWLGQRH